MQANQNTPEAESENDEAPIVLRRSPRSHGARGASRPKPVPTAKRTALCWHFFYGTDPMPTHPECYYCLAKVKCNKDSSSNLTRHAKTQHSALYNDFESKQQGNEEVVLAPSLVARQTKLMDGFAKTFNQANADQMLTEFIINDDQSFRVRKKYSIYIII
jgi:hypothetical protein